VVMQPLQVRCVAAEEILNSAKEFRLENKGASLPGALEHEIEPSRLPCLRLRFATTGTPNCGDRTRISRRSPQIQRSARSSASGLPIPTMSALIAIVSV